MYNTISDKVGFMLAILLFFNVTSFFLLFLVTALSLVRYFVLTTLIPCFFHIVNFLRF